MSPRREMMERGVEPDLLPPVEKAYGAGVGVGQIV